MVNDKLIAGVCALAAFILNIVAPSMHIDRMVLTLWVTAIITAVLVIKRLAQDDKLWWEKSTFWTGAIGAVLVFIETVLKHKLTIPPEVIEGSAFIVAGMAAYCYNHRHKAADDKYKAAIAAGCVMPDKPIGVPPK